MFSLPNKDSRELASNRKRPGPFVMNQRPFLLPTVGNTHECINELISMVTFRTISVIGALALRAKPKTRAHSRVRFYRSAGSSTFIPFLFLALWAGLAQRTQRYGLNAFLLQPYSLPFVWVHLRVGSCTLRFNVRRTIPH